MGAKDYRMYVNQGHRGLGTSAASVSLYATPPPTVGSAARFNKWAYLLSSGVYPDRKRASRTASARFKVTMHSTLQGNVDIPWPFGAC